ncbi:MAG: flagellar basal body rod protein FlgC [Desulfovibrionaceae bacterium]|nr:flagellar basal body rod protein FlgC [Desulfovibrionaceae bacterium]MBF0513022.1 flagellar basal body rod protein FlgC [Desulfovibrionaceae bacterium]
MDMMTAFDIAASGMSAERTSMNVISMNLANAKTTRTATGGPYQRKAVALRQAAVQSPFASAMNSAMDEQLKGVKVAGIVTDNRPPRMVYEPGSPDADKNGYVSYPDINMVEEMTNMITTSRSYEANVASVNNVKTMYNKALTIGS